MFPEMDNYEFLIRGSLGIGPSLISVKVFFNIKDPCPFATLSLYEPNALYDQMYVLRDPAIDMPWK